MRTTRLGRMIRALDERRERRESWKARELVGALRGVAAQHARDGGVVFTTTDGFAVTLADGTTVRVSLGRRQ
jgi:hypothetical protein